MTRSFLAAVLLAAAVPSDALAGELALGARLGFASPRGKIDSPEYLSDFVDWTWPLQLEVGYQGEQALVGLYLRVAPGKLDPQLQAGCDAANTSCNVTDYGIGAQVTFHFAAGRAGPWLGGFAGYEALKYEATVGGVPGSITPSGWEIGAQGGLDFAMGRLTLGPYATISLGQFTKSTMKIGGTSDTQTITDRAAHTWLGLGLRLGLAL